MPDVLRMFCRTWLPALAVLVGAWLFTYEYSPASSSPQIGAWVYYSQESDEPIAVGRVHRDGYEMHCKGGFCCHWATPGCEYTLQAPLDTPGEVYEVVGYSTENAGAALELIMHEDSDAWLDEFWETMQFWKPKNVAYAWAFPVYETYDEPIQGIVKMPLASLMDIFKAVKDFINGGVFASLGDPVVLGVNRGPIDMLWAATTPSKPKIVIRPSDVYPFLLAAPVIEFNTDGMINDPSYRGSFTALELRTVLTDPALRAKTRFWMHDHVVTAHFVIKVFPDILSGPTLRDFPELSKPRFGND